VRVRLRMLLAVSAYFIVVHVTCLSSMTSLRIFIMATDCSSVRPSSLSRCTNLSVSKWWSRRDAAVREKARLAGSAPMGEGCGNLVCDWRVASCLAGEGRVWNRRRGERARAAAEGQEHCCRPRGFVWRSDEPSQAAGLRRVAMDGLGQSASGLAKVARLPR
jgi:hypothetical protein